MEERLREDGGKERRGNEAADSEQLSPPHIRLLLYKFFSSISRYEKKREDSVELLFL